MIPENVQRWIEGGDGTSFARSGEVQPDAYSPSRYGLGAASDEATYGRMGESLQGMAKNVALSGINPASVMGGLFNTGYSAAGVEVPEGILGALTSRAPAVIGSMLGGPALGLMGAAVGAPFADAIGDISDTRVNEKMRDAIEGHFGQVAGRKGYADIESTLNEPTALSNESVKAAMDMMQAHAKVGSPDLQALNMKDYETLKSVYDMMQQPAPQRPTHNWGIDPFGGMSSQMEANMRGKYGSGWSRDSFLGAPKSRTGISGGGNGGGFGGSSGGRSSGGTSAGRSGGRGGFGGASGGGTSHGR